MSSCFAKLTNRFGRFKLFSAAILLNSSVALASIIDNGQYTTDTASGLDWLDATTAIGYSYDQVLSGSGGYLNGGWRYATRSEVYGLFRNIGPVPETWYPGASYTAALSLIRMLGVVVSTNNNEGIRQVFVGSPIESIGVQGYYNDQGSSNLAGFADLQARLIDYDPLSNLSARWTAFDDFLDPGRNQTNIGHFLVRQSSQISLPPSAGLLLIGVSIFCLSRLCSMRRFNV